MKNKLYLLAAILVCSSSLFAQIPGWAWAHSATGSNRDLNYPTFNTSDAAGNVYVVGGFSSSTIQFGTTTLTRATANAVDNIFVVKYDSSGIVLWAKAAGGDLNANCKAIAIDHSGNLYLAGWFYGDSISFGGLATLRAKHLQVTLQTSDWFLAKYDASGNLSWAKTQDTTSQGLLYLNGVATDASGNVIVCGGVAAQAGSVIYNGGNIISSSQGTNDIMIAKFDGSGAAQWARAAGNTGAYDVATGIAVDAAGNSYITGTFQSSAAHFGSNLLVGNNSSPHLFLAKYNSQGTNQWAKGSNTSGLGNGWKTVVDRNNHVYMAATYQADSISFGTHVLHRADTAVTGNIALVLYDSAGTALWAVNAGHVGIGSSGPTCLASSASGELLISGAFGSPRLVLGADTLINKGGTDIFLAAFNASGSPVWTKSYGSSKAESGYATYDALGNVILSGGYGSSQLIVGIDTFSNVDTPAYHTFVARAGVRQVPVSTGIANVNADAQINVYPNPSTGRITISLPESAKEISLNNLLGQELSKTELNGQKHIEMMINTNGIYLITVKTDKQTTTRRVSIER